jgi:hypothetical protein
VRCRYGPAEADHRVANMKPPRIALNRAARAIIYSTSRFSCMPRGRRRISRNEA